MVFLTLLAGFFPPLRPLRPFRPLLILNISPASVGSVLSEKGLYVTDNFERCLAKPRLGSAAKSDCSRRNV